MIKGYAIGRIATEPKMNFSIKTGATICKFLFVSNSSIDDKENESEIEDVIPVICYDETAVYVCEFLKKGSLVFLDGNIKNISYSDYNGIKHYSQIFLASDVECDAEDMESSTKKHYCSPEKIEQYFSYMVENDCSFIDSDEYDILEKIAKEVMKNAFGKNKP